VVEALRACARRVAAARAEVEEVWLFGSYARGDATARSDADVLVVIRGPAPGPAERARPYRFDGAPVPVDVLVATRAEVDAARAAGAGFLPRALARAIRLVPTAPPP
jgi:predicted nucleotidyltransferase